LGDTDTLAADFLGLRPLSSIGEEVTEPDPSGTAEAFSQAGYRFELAVADIVDNSIDAKADNVLVRFITDSETVRRIVIADDGHGMSPEALKTAMQYGAQVQREPTDLGKFGVGMKSASLSQCRSVSVVSRSDGLAAGRRWTSEAIRAGWKVDLLDPGEIESLLRLPWGNVDTSEHGTLIVWDGLDRLRAHRDGVEKTIDRLFKVLNIHLGLVFHRFLEGRGLRLQIDRVDASTWDSGLPATVEPLNPFGYPTSGSDQYPRTFTIPIDSGLRVDLRAHTWPARSTAPGYKLGGGKVAARQGFYFYRNDRVIQAGGWNGWRDNDSEPHLSLARVAVDLPRGSDRAFGLSLHKSLVDVPEAYTRGLDTVVDSEGVAFRDYVAAAQAAYRSANGTASDRVAIPVLGRGVGPALRAASRRIVAQGDRNVRPYNFTWVKMSSSTVVDLDHEADEIRVNSMYRSRLVGESNGALVRALLFIAVRQLLGRERTSAPLRRDLATTNALLLSAMLADEAKG
jgi:hypothetical protein